jgi:hypothetical protein
MRGLFLLPSCEKQLFGELISSERDAFIMQESSKTGYSYCQIVTSAKGNETLIFILISKNIY